MVNTGDRRRVGFWVLIGVLGVSGISMAFIAVFGLFDSTAFSLVWRVFVADLYLIASLAAQHRWLRWTAWIGTAVTFLLGLVNVFWRYTPYYEWADGRTNYTVGDSGSGWSPWFGFEGDLEASAHLILVGVILLGFVSLAYRWVAGERLLRAIYVFTFVSGLVSVLLGAVLILDSPFRWNLSSGWEQALAGFVILALTAMAIVIIAAFVQRNAARARVRAAEGAQAAAIADGLVPSAALSPAPSGSSVSAAGIADDELRVLVRTYVDEYLAERGL